DRPCGSRSSPHTVERANCRPADIGRRLLQLNRRSGRLSRIFDPATMIVRPSMPSWAAKVGLLCLLAVSGWQCLDTPNYPIEPPIGFVALYRETMDQGVFEEDSIIVVYSYQDGDGDIGRDAQSGGNNVFFIVRRSNTLDNTYGIPEIPQEGAANGVE